jgi:DNA processing protein
MSPNSKAQWSRSAPSMVMAPRTPKYIPPTSVQVKNLSEALAGRREIPLGQQHRLGYDGNQDGVALWCAGDLSLIQRPCVAIVGTRNASPEGAARARRLAKELTAAGVVIVSGLAKGIDTEALTSTMDNGGHVIAVIGTPIDKAYPAENKRLQERVYSGHLLVSQFRPGAQVFPSNFPERNKTMAALSDATVIIEASDTSGTIHQAAECVRLGRWLFISKAVLDDATLTWPGKFRHQPKVLPLTATSDIVSVLSRE